MRSKEAITQDLVKRHKELKELVGSNEYGQDKVIHGCIEELQEWADAPANAAKARAAQYDQDARSHAAMESMKTRR